MIDCRVLGPLDVFVDGKPPPPSLLWRKNIALAVYLARSPGGKRTRDHLVGLLWADSPDDAARQSLRESLRVLRQSAGKESIETDASTVTLRPGSVTLDVNELESLAKRSEWQRAAALVRGEFLEGFTVPDVSGFEDWLTSERNACRNNCVAVLVQAADHAIAMGDIGVATEWSALALKLEPGSDAAVQVSMKSLALLGNRSAALRDFETFSAHLKEFSVEPQPDTVSLMERVRNGREWRRWIPPQEPDTMRRAPLIGRSGELEVAIERWNSCRRDRQATCLLIEGDPGTGKTRLGEEIVERTRLDGAVTVTTRLVDADLTEEAGGILAIAGGGMLSGSGVSAVDPASVATLASRLESWADRFPGAKLVGQAVPLGHCLRDVVRAVASEEPVVLFLDDVQYLDAFSFVELESLLVKLADLPLFVVLGAPARSTRDELDRLRRRVGGEIAGNVFSLNMLSSDDLLSLARWSVPSYDEEHVERLARRIEIDSAGLPLLALELLQAIANGMELSDEAGAWPEPLRTLDHTMPADLPEAVVGAIRVRFRSQSREAQELLCAAAVAEGRVSTDQLEKGTSLSGDVLFRALDELEWDRWFSADHRGYDFIARIVRDVVLRDMITKGRRARIAAALAPTASVS